MNLETQNMTKSAYNDGKQCVMEVLANVIESMKSKETNATAIIFNSVLDELYEKVKVEVD